MTNSRRNCRGTTPTSPRKPFVTSSTSRSTNSVLIRASSRGAIARRVDLAETQRHGTEPLGVERGELELRLPQAREPALLEEADPLVERREAGDAVPGVEELGGAGEDPEETRVRPGGVRDLADAVQGLVPRVAPHPEDRLRLVDDDEQPLVARRLHDLEHAPEVVERVPARRSRP